MSDWLLSIAGTPEGAALATVLALISAFAHAVFGAMQKGAHDPWLSRGAMDLWFAIYSAPIALLLLPWPSGEMWLWLLGALALHFSYKVSIALAYERAAFTVVYPVVRGIGPLITVLAAMVIFAERYSALQWLGLACLSGGILLLALRNLAEEKLDLRALKIGLAWAVAGGVMVAAYTTFDAAAIRRAPDPLHFLVWFFFITSLDFPILAWLRYRRMTHKPAPGPLMIRGAVGAVVGYVSFGGIMLATLVGKVGEAAALRETSTVFAALIGWFILRDKVGSRRLVLMSMIAAGAVLIELGAVR
ncbi:EamA family transporter [Rhodobacteraceae bacterium 2376]|uniref:EamA family transporter n=1 Tax=Rhabdonatronobacter sediminivivens TaxID=2743469 RepID=A0A7Z0HX92_9RHOB|nr:DMT family transporter [Rhabdonatronobacter sediminivivens]NYS23996.1 EamA family transporter [Rhabdonatronobacter sediminivivens]